MHEGEPLIVLTWMALGQEDGPCRGNRHWRTGDIERCVHGRIGYAGMGSGKTGARCRAVARMVAAGVQPD